MSTAIATRQNGQAMAASVYDKIANPLEFATAMGPAASSIMGAPLDQGPAIALTALCEGYTLVEMRRRYHWIGGRPVMQAAAMLAEFRMNYGGDYTVDYREADGCRMTFRDAAGREYKVALTWEDCEASRWPWVNWKDHARGLKDNWATPLDRKTMIFSRLVSDSLKFICPELAAGVYTPEEMQDVIEGQVVAPARKASEVIAEQAAKVSEVADADGSDAMVFVVEEDTDANSEVFVVEPDEPPFDAAATPDPTAPGSITDSQAAAIRNLFAELGVSADQQAAILKKREVSAVRNLSSEQAKELIGKMQDKMRQMVSPPIEKN